MQHQEDVLGHVGIQLAGGLVGQQQGRVVGQGHRDGDPLLLAAGQFRGVTPALVRHLQGVQQFFRPLATLPPVHAGDGLGKLDVVPHIQVGDQVAARGLPDEPHLTTTILHQLLIADVQQVPFAHPDPARRWALQAGQDVEQCGLARTAGAHNANQLARFHLQIDTAQRDHFQIRRLVDFEEIVGLHIGRKSIVVFHILGQRFRRRQIFRFGDGRGSGHRVGRRRFNRDCRNRPVGHLRIRRGCDNFRNRRFSPGFDNLRNFHCGRFRRGFGYFHNFRSGCFRRCFGYLRAGSSRPTALRGHELPNMLVIGTVLWRLGHPAQTHQRVCCKTDGIITRIVSVA